MLCRAIDRKPAEWKTRKNQQRHSGTAYAGCSTEGKHGGNLSQVVNEIANSVCFGDGPAFSKIALGHGLHAFRNYHCSISRSNLQF